MHKPPKHLFIIGNPRSGTSLLRIMLNSHSQITVPPECGFMEWWYDKYKNWSEESNIDEFIQDLKTSRKIETWGLNYEKLYKFLHKETCKSYDELVFKVVEFYGFSKTKKKQQKVLGDKNNYYISCLNKLREFSLDSVFIFIIRDPKAVFASYNAIKALQTNSAYKPKLSSGVDKFLEEWFENHHKILNFIDSMKRNDFLIISYENLVLNTKEELLKATNFLNLKFDIKMLKYYEVNDEPNALLDWKKKTLKPPDSDSIYQYKSVLSKEEKNRIDKETKPLLKRLLNNYYV
jgi:hypothetical protein